MSTTAPRPRHIGAGSTALVIALTLLVTTVVGAARAGAHAGLVGSEPARSAVLQDAPAVVRLWFSELVDSGVSAIEVTTVDRDVVADSTRADPSQAHGLIVDLPADLPDGVYVVRWRVLSGADGHITGGMLAFGVGAAADPAAVAGRETEAATSRPDVALRALGFLAFAALVGGLAVALGLLEAERVRAMAAGAGQARRRAQARLLSMSAAGAAGAIIVGFGTVALQQRLLRSGALVDGGAPSLRELLTDTRWGILWLVRQSSLVVAVALILRARRTVLGTPFDRALRRGLGATAVSAAAVAALAHALGGHAAAVDDTPGLAVAADAVHLFAAACWVGGLVALLVMHAQFARSDDARALIRPVWRSFGPLAAVCVGLVAVTGVHGLAQQTTSLDAALTTGYGRTLMAKTVLFATMGALGLTSAAILHRAVGLRVGRALRRPPGWVPGPARLRLLVTVEATLGTGALLLAGLASASPPAVGPEFAAPTGTELTTRSEFADGVLVSLSVHPNRAGPNVVSVRATSTRRPPPAPLDVVLVRLKRQDDGPTDTVTLERVGDGHYEGSTTALDRVDQWRMEVVLRRAGVDDAGAAFDWELPATATRARVVSNRPWEGPLEALAVVLLAAGLLLAASAWRVARARRAVMPATLDVVPDVRSTAEVGGR